MDGPVCCGISHHGRPIPKQGLPAENPTEPILHRKQLFTSAEDRFRESAPKSGWKNAAD